MKTFNEIIKLKEDIDYGSPNTLAAQLFVLSGMSLGDNTVRSMSDLEAKIRDKFNLSDWESTEIVYELKHNTNKVVNRMIDIIKDKKNHYLKKQREAADV